MSIVLWVILIHVIEIILIGGYLLVRKNSQLEKVIVNQQQYIDALGVVIQNSNEMIQQLDNKGAFESDDEVGTFFKNIKEIQNILDQFNPFTNTRSVGAYPKRPYIFAIVVTRSLSNAIINMASACLLLPHFSNS